MASVEHEKRVEIKPEALVNTVRRRTPPSRSGAISRSRAATRSTRSNGSAATPSSPARTSRCSTRRASSSPSSGRRPRRTSSPRSTSAAACRSPERESSVRQMIGRVVDTIGRWGREGGYFATEEEAADLRGRAEGDPRQPARRLQLARLVQRRLRGDASVLGVLHPLDRGLDGLDPRLDPARGDHLPRRLRLGRQPLAAALLEGAALQGRPRLRPGLVHARRRRLGRDDQVGRQDAPRREDGRPRRRPSRHPRVRLVQGARGGEGARPRGGRLRHVARLARLVVDPVPEREQLGPRLRRVHAGGRGRRPTGT